MPGGYLALANSDVGQGQREEDPLAAAAAAGKQQSRSSRGESPPSQRATRPPTRSACETNSKVAVRQKSNGELGSPWAQCKSRGPSHQSL